MKAVRLLVIPAKSEFATRLVEMKPELSVLQAWVGGDIEEIHTGAGLMIANTNGKYEQLLFNHRASVLAEREIVGDVILTGGADEDGNLLEYKGPKIR